MKSYINNAIEDIRRFIEKEKKKKPYENVVREGFRQCTQLNQEEIQRCNKAGQKKIAQHYDSIRQWEKHHNRG